MLEALAYISLNSDNIRDHYNRITHILCSALIIYNIFSTAVFLIFIEIGDNSSKNNENKIADFSNKKLFVIKQMASFLFNFGYGPCLVYNMMKIAFRVQDINQDHSIGRYRSRNQYTISFTSSYLGIYFLVTGVISALWSFSEVKNHNLHERYKDFGGLLKAITAFEANSEFFVNSLILILVVLFTLRRICYLRAEPSIGRVKQYSSYSSQELPQVYQFEVMSDSEPILN